MRGGRGWLVDTNVISELRRPRPNASVLEFIAAQVLESLYVSCVTMAELRFGVLRSTDAELGAAIEVWIEESVRPMFADRTLDVFEADMLRWRILVDEGRRMKHTFSQPDLLIAAQALERDLTVVTRNTRDFERAGVPVFNPWSETPRSHT